MCALLDANAVGDVLAADRSAAAGAFFNWITRGRGKLVVARQIHDELRTHSKFDVWYREAIQQGRILRVDDDEVETRASELREARTCLSDDEHVIAAAQVGGARLLYSNDRALQRDFKNKDLIDQPRGKVYTTLHGSEYTKSHNRLLGNRSLCARGNR